MNLGNRPQERTLDELFDVLNLHDEDYLLTKLAEANKILCECEVEVHPRLQDNPPEGTFLLRRKNATVTSEVALRDRLAKHETSLQEFKSTYWCDLKRRVHQPEATPQELRSNAVKHSALKSIAGFLTTGGGTLYVGVSDAGEVLGIQPDLELLAKNQRHTDHLINNIKTDVAQRFYEGNTVNDYLSIEAIDVGCTQVLQLEVASRRKLSFLQSPEGNTQLFRRQDNRTITVPIYELEEFLTWRSKYVLSDGQ